MAGVVMIANHDYACDKKTGTLPLLFIDTSLILVK